MNHLGKSLLMTLVLVVAVFLFVPPVIAQEEPIIVDFFDDRLCPVCKDAREFIQGLEDDYPHMELRIHPISDIDKLNEVAEKHNIDDFRVIAPTISIGDNFFQFWEFTSYHEDLIIKALDGETVKVDTGPIKISFMNIELNLSDWSLPLITFLLGSLDGFNICSIGALTFVLLIVMGLDSRRKMFLYGGVFILTVVVIYGSLVFIWGGLLKVLIGHLEILRIIVGLASLGGAIYFLKEFWRFFKYGPTCQASGSKMVSGITKKLRDSFEAPNKKTLSLIGSVMLFAAVITIVELPCSIGLPVVFTGILIERELSFLVYSLYILAYLFFYMFIELAIFTGAVLTKKIWFAESRMITWITFAGSMILFYLAFYYLFL